MNKATFAPHFKKSSLTNFESLGLSSEVLQAIEELGFETPSKIQEKAIPFLMSGDRDFIGLAQTGTGKTAAFGLPLVSRVDPFVNNVQALILAPTRELGQQISGQLELFSKYLFDLNILAVYGGTSITNQIKALKKPQHIVIATPGRLLDLIKRKAIRLTNVKYLILDEADEMLNMGFKEDIDAILKYTVSKKETWLFSATMPPEIKRMVNSYMTDPIQVRIDSQDKVNTNITHTYVEVKRHNKQEILTRFIDTTDDLRGIIFCRTKKGTQDLSDSLNALGYKVDALHGDLSQRQRDRVMSRFKSQQLQILIATDVAARGIDVNDLTHVFHYSLPDDLTYYTHRAGRTARAGNTGLSIAFIGDREKRKLERLAKDLSITFEPMTPPQLNDILTSRIDRWCLKILETPSKAKDNHLLIDKASMLFANLTKEELIAKLINHETGQLQHMYSADEDSSPSKSSRRGQSRRGKGGSSGGRGRSGGKGRSGGRGRSDERGGSSSNKKNYMRLEKKQKSSKKRRR